MVPSPTWKVTFPHSLGSTPYSMRLIDPWKGDRRTRGLPSPEGSRGGYTDRELIEALQEQALRASQAAREADGAIIGAAADSNPGASRLAGQGSQELTGDPH